MANDKSTFEQRTFVTPMGRVSFPAVFEPRSFEGQEPKYELTLLFDKESTDLSELKKRAKVALVGKWGPHKTNWPKNLKMPFHDGDEKEDLSGYNGTIYVKATSKMKPQIVDRRHQEILDPEQFYAGCYARAQLVAFAYDTGGKGVSFMLLMIQKLKDGEPFTPRKDPKEVFETLEDDSAEETSGDDWLS